MFLDRLIERNPALLETALQMHQSGRIPPNTYVIDLDAIADNARAIAAEARRLDLTTFLMSKQYARNPYVTWVALANGLYKTVAVDAPGALQMRRYGIPIGHMGHLEQIPRHLVRDAVAMHPDYITIYNVEHARWINAAAAELGVTQNLLVRVYAPSDVFFEGQEGGVVEKSLPSVAAQIRLLPHVRLAGVTAFPCVRYNQSPTEPLTSLTPNFYTAKRALAELGRMGFDDLEFNAPGNTSVVTMSLMHEQGATQVEPGHGLTGTTPNHAYRGDLPERPAYVLVSEISHFFGDRAYAFGGGLFADQRMPGATDFALVGSNWTFARENRLNFLHEIEQIIDYHAVLEPASRAHIGDSVLLGFRTQMQMTRAYIAPVYGISRGAPRFDYLFDTAGTALDEHYDPVAPEEVRRHIDQLIGTGTQ